MSLIPMSDADFIDRLQRDIAVLHQQLAEARALLMEITGTYQVWSVLTDAQRARVEALRHAA